MKKLLAGVLALFSAALLALVGAVALQPDHFHMERSTTVNAKPADVYAIVSDLSRYPEWNPWQDKDPAMKTEVSQPPTGVGAWYAWEGNSEAGKGRMEITAVESNASVTESLHFLAPMASEAVVVMKMTPEGEKTRVSWGFDSEQTLPSKAFGLIMDVEALIGPDFEKGLGRIQAIAEPAARAREAQEAADLLANEQAAAALAAATPTEGAPPPVAD